MSLINDVLRDLDRRQAETAGISSVTTGLQALPGPKKKAWWPWLAGAILLGAGAQLAYMTWPLPTTESVPLGPQTAAVAPEPMLLASVAEREPEIPADLDEAPVVESPRPSMASSLSPATANTEPTATRISPQSPADRAAVPQADEPIDPAEAQASAQPEPVAESAEPAPPDSEAPARIEIQRSANRENEDPVEQALRAAARGQMGLAQSQLNNHLKEAPGDTRARLLLAEVLVSDQRPLSARSVLETGLNKDSAMDLAPALARLLQTSDPAAAREVLLRHPPPPTDAPDYHLLLAALHRQLGDHEQAADLYQQLTGLDSSNITAWVGLGSSLESLGKPADARAAYEIAAQSGAPRLSGFARQRLSALPATGEQP